MILIGEKNQQNKINKGETKPGPNPAIVSACAESLSPAQGLSYRNGTP